MDRYTAIQQVVSALKEIDGGISPFNSAYTFKTNLFGGVENHFVFVDEINSFPSVFVTANDERIVHQLSNERLSVLSLDIRGYTYDENVEESGEELAEDIEHVLKHYQQWRDVVSDWPEGTLEDVRLNLIRTDCGLHAPYGVCMFVVVVLYIR